MAASLRRVACLAGLLALLPGSPGSGFAQAKARPPAAAQAAPAADPNPGVRNYLQGVTAISPADAWAVGYYCVSGCNTNSEIDRTLIEHWDGTSWAQLASPDPSPRINQLSSVTATSATDAWAVGYYCAARCLQPAEAERTLILHWDGTAWSQVPSPNAYSDELSAVTATSATDAWAVGHYCESGCLNVLTLDGTLIVHWDGTAWSRVRSPSPGATPHADLLSGVVATGTGDAWAGGGYCASGCGTPSEVDRNLIEHWNGTAWSRVHSPTPAGGPNLQSVSADSAGDAWAAGWDNATSGSKSMILHWNGTAWSKAASPNPSSASILRGLNAQSPTDAWAVGQYFSSKAGMWRTLIVHWNGMAWLKVASPTPGAGPEQVGSLLYQVSADSPGDGWAVGSYCASQCATNSERDHTMILHWNGTRWSVA